MNKVLDTLTSLAACLCEQIRIDGSPEPCWCGVMPGQQALLEALGNACDGGLAWVRLINSYPSNAIGQQAANVGNCGVGIGFDIEIGIVRMTEVERDAPDPAESLAQAMQQIEDMATMRRAVSCCDALHPKDFILGQYQPFGPLGAVVGGSWTIYAGA